METAAIYCRVSTEDQEKEGTSLQTQMDACQQYCQDKGYGVVQRFSEAYSGLALERPKLNELRETIRAQNIDVVVVYSLDRFSRDPVHGVILMQEMERHGVKLEAATETVDNSEIGKLIFYIKGYAAKLDAERRRDATGRGKKAYVQKGILPIGTGKGLYGYKWDNVNKRRVILEFEANVVRLIFKMLADGAGYFRVARMLNDQRIPTKTQLKWSVRTIYNMAGNPCYIGTTYYGRTYGSRKTKRLSQPRKRMGSAS